MEGFFSAEMKLENVWTCLEVLGGAGRRSWIGIGGLSLGVLIAGIYLGKAEDETGKGLGLVWMVF